MKYEEIKPWTDYTDIQLKETWSKNRNMIILMMILFGINLLSGLIMENILVILSTMSISIILGSILMVEYLSQDRRDMIKEIGKRNSKVNKK